MIIDQGYINIIITPEKLIHDDVFLPIPNEADDENSFFTIQSLFGLTNCQVNDFVKAYGSGAYKSKTDDFCH